MKALVFKYRSNFHNDLFQVQVDLKGCSLLEQSSDRFSVYGVYPTWISAHGETITVALTNFRAAFIQTVQGIIDRSDSIEIFRKLMMEFFLDPNPELLGRWCSLKGRSPDIYLSLK